MTTTRCVGASFAIAACAILVLAACGASGPPPGSPQALYINLGCAKCHGPAREGQRSGPALTGLAERWDAATLTSYLRNPPAYVETNPRLSYIAEQYPIAMPAYPEPSDEDLQKLIAFILSS